MYFFIIFIIEKISTSMKHVKIRSAARDSSRPEDETNVIFFTGTGGRCCTVGPHRRTRTLAGTHPSAQPFGTAPVGPHRWTAPSDTNPCGNAPFGTALRHSPISHPSSSWHQSYPYIHIHIHQPYIYIYLSWVIVGLAGECVKVALRVL